MRKELDEALCKKYPKIFQDRNVGQVQTTLTPFGFEHADGWFVLLEELCAKLTVIEKACGLITVAVQVKEKFGTLRFYTRITHDATQLEWECNTRYWLKNLCLVLRAIGDWLHSHVPNTEYYGTKLSSYDVKHADGTVGMDTVCDFGNIIATPYIRVKHFVVKQFLSHVWWPMHWALDRHTHVHYRRDLGKYTQWHRWYPDKYEARITKAIQVAEAKSAVTCEICGKPGQLDTCHYWLQTLCPDCTAARYKAVTDSEALNKQLAEELSKKVSDESPNSV